MTTDQAEKAIIARIQVLQRSRERKDRCKAQMLGEILGNWRKGRLGDCFLIGQAQGGAK